MCASAFLLVKLRDLVEGSRRGQVSPLCLGMDEDVYY